jgi:drug/metabolite transporter (DMT)-like permease
MDHMKISLKLQGLFLVILSMIIYGLNPVFANYLVKNIDPFLLAGASFLIASIPLLVQLVVSKDLHYLYKGKFLKSLLFVTAFALVGDTLFFLGTYLTTGINTAILLQLEPIYALILASIFLGEIIKARQIFAVLTVVLGAIIIVNKGTESLNVGDIFIITAPLFYQLSHLTAKNILNKISNVTIVPAARLLYGGILLTTFALFIKPELVSGISFTNFNNIILYGLYLSLDYFLWYQVLKRLPLSVASAFLPFSIIVSILGAMLLLKETITLPQYLGASLVLGGLLWLSLMYLKKKKK